MTPSRSSSYYGVSEDGNFEGSNVLHLAGGAESAGAARPGRGAAGAATRRGRSGSGPASTTSASPPGTRWRSPLWPTPAPSSAARTTSTPPRGCAEFVLSQLRDEGGNLLRTYKDGRAHLNAYLEDHAFLLEALLALYEATFEQRWFDEARALAETTIERFGDPERGGFYSTSADHEELIARRKEVGDHPIPSGNSSAAMGLLRLAALTGERHYAEWAEGVFALFGKPAVEHPDAFAHLLRALDFHLSPTREVALVGDDLAELAAVVRERHRPHLVLAGGPEGTEEPPLLAGRTAVDGKPAAYVCENFACRLPVTGAEDLRRLL